MTTQTIEAGNTYQTLIFTLNGQEYALDVEKEEKSSRPYSLGFRPVSIQKSSGVPKYELFVNEQKVIHKDKDFHLIDAEKLKVSPKVPNSDVLVCTITTVNNVFMNFLIDTTSTPPEAVFSGSSKKERTDDPDFNRLKDFQDFERAANVLKRQARCTIL